MAAITTISFSSDQADLANRPQIDNPPHKGEEKKHQKAWPMEKKNWKWLMESDCVWHDVGLDEVHCTSCE